jgi:hypothetical protein
MKSSGRSHEAEDGEVRSQKPEDRMQKWGEDGAEVVE